MIKYQQELILISQVSVYHLYKVQVLPNKQTLVITSMIHLDNRFLIGYNIYHLQTVPCPMKYYSYLEHEYQDECLHHACDSEHAHDCGHVVTNKIQQQ